MGFWQRLIGTEERAEGGEGSYDALLSALLQQGPVTRKTALEVPSVAGGIDLIASMIASTPIKLYRERDGKAEEVKNDPRIGLLNDETGDTLNAEQFWRAMVRDYFLGKGGFAYINKRGNEYSSIHYVKECDVSIIPNVDPIFKDYTIEVAGHSYQPFEFLKILRNTDDGMQGKPITEELQTLIAAAYQGLQLEKRMSLRGGNKKGFFKSENKLDDDAFRKLKTAATNLYSNDKENFMVLNKGLGFQECSDTAVEMQLVEHKKCNADEFAKIFHISPDMVSGKDKDTTALAKVAAMPLMMTIQCALNRDLLLEREKGEYYWAFDTKELLKGEMKDRFAAYKTALDANFMQIDEVRFAEDMEPLGLSWIKIGLDDVLYDPKTNTVYTPNTNQTVKMDESSLQLAPKAGNIESEEPETRAQWTKGAKGLFTGSVGAGATGGGKVSTTRMSGKEAKRVSHQIATDFPKLKAGSVHDCYNRKYRYKFKVNDFGDYTFLKKSKLK